MSRTKDIQRLVGKQQALKFHNPVVQNITPLSFSEFDVLSVSKSGFVYEFEVKISRSDFKADAKKRKFAKYAAPHVYASIIPNYFSYVCPKDLISESEIPIYAGLYYHCDTPIEEYPSGVLIEIRKPKLIHKQMHNKNEIFEKVCRVNSEREFLGKCRLTYENDIVRERNKNLMSL